MMDRSGAYPDLFRPITVGGMTLRNRIMLPPHAARIGNILGSEADARENIAYWSSRIRDGAAWAVAVTGLVGNTIVPAGFEPTGIGAVVEGDFRLPISQERFSRLVSAIHEAGGCISGQLNMIGGMPHAPSQRLSSYVAHDVPHQLDQDEIDWLIEEYAFSAGLWRDCGFDGVEIHMNHDDIFQWFMSPATNRRTDAYGGDRTGRLRFASKTIAAIRERIGSDCALGLRVNLCEFIEGGYQLDEGVAMCRELNATRQVDYFSVVMGGPWTMPSYVQPQFYSEGKWADQAAALRRAVEVPVIYTGSVRSLDVANRLVAEGHADVVGLVRAVVVEPNLISKSRAGRFDEIKPCIGCNECVNRFLYEGLKWSCAVNPGIEFGEPSAEVSGSPKRVAVVGGGPGGMEAAALLAERGHHVTLWERETSLGGQMRLAAQVPSYGSYADYITFQEKRLMGGGVDLRKGEEATIALLKAEAPDAIVIATGGTARRPDVPGADLPLVLTDHDVLRGAAFEGPVVLIAQDDGFRPLATALFLARTGRRVQMVYEAPAIASAVGRYSLGTYLGHLSQAGVTFQVMQRVTSIGSDRIDLANIYSGIRSEIRGFGSVVLSCGNLSERTLHGALKPHFPNLHVLGDAYAPRKIIFATRRAYILANGL